MPSLVNAAAKDDEKLLLRVERAGFGSDSVPAHVLQTDSLGFRKASSTLRTSFGSTCKRCCSRVKRQVVISWTVRVHNS